MHILEGSPASDSDHTHSTPLVPTCRAFVLEVAVQPRDGVSARPALIGGGQNSRVKRAPWSPAQSTWPCRSASTSGRTIDRPIPLFLLSVKSGGSPLPSSATVTHTCDPCLPYSTRTVPASRPRNPCRTALV